MSKTALAPSCLDAIAEAVEPFPTDIAVTSLLTAAVSAIVTWFPRRRIPEVLAELEAAVRAALEEVDETEH